MKGNFNSKSLLVLMTLTIILVVIKTETLTFSRLTQLLKQSTASPFVNLHLFYDTATETGKQLETVVPMITQKRKNYFKVNYFDCNTQDEQVLQTLTYCTKQMRDKLPALIYTEPTLNLGEPKQHQYQGSLSEQALFKFAEPLIKAFSVNLTKVRDWHSLKQKNSEVPTILYFTDKDKLPTIYKALTTNFRKTIAFAHVQKGSPVAQLLNVTTFPTILLNGKDEIPLSKNLQQMISRLQVIQGQQTTIQISQFSSNIQSLTSDNIQKLVYELPEHILIHVNHPDGTVHEEWKKCRDSFKKMFTYYETDNLAKELGVKNTPAIVYFPKSLAKKSVQKSIFYPKDTFRTIYDEVSSLIQDFTVPLVNDMQMQRLTSLPLQQGKFVAVLFHQDEISLSYRVLSNDEDYKKDIVFFRMKNPDEQVMAKFKITKLPSLYVMLNDVNAEGQQNDKNKKKEQLPEGRMQMNLQIAHYTGKYNYDELTNYFSMFLRKQQSSSKTSPTPSSGTLIDIAKKKQFLKHCKEQSCYLLLTDGRQQKKQSQEVYKNEIKKFSGRINEPFTVIDGICHSEILGQLQIQQQELPVFVYLNSKFQKYSRLIGRIEQKSINSFISKVKSNKVHYRGYSTIQFADGKNCLQQHKKLREYQQGQTSEPALDQDQLQILKQIQQQQRKKQEQKQRLQKEAQKQSKKKRKRRPKNEQSDWDL